MLNNKYEYTKIRENIWQIAEDKGVYSTLVKGSKMAVLIDTGYGARNLRAFVEENITTPYMVINSHGHPDHMGGNHWFDTVYSLKEEWDVIKYFEENQPMKYEMKEIQIGQHISLGDLNIIVVSLAGHTKGSIGFIVQEEEILIAGDALNEGLWLFNYGSLSMMDLYQTIKATTGLDFSTYLCGHSNEEYHKEKLFSHMKNIENLKIDSSTKQNTIGFETYCSKYEDANGKSEIVFTIDKVMKSAKLEYRSFAIEDAQLYLEKEIHLKEGFMTPPKHVNFEAKKLFGSIGEIMDGAIAYLSVGGGGPTEQHTHEHNHLFIVTEGEARILLGDEEVIVKKNESFLVEGRIPHSVWNNIKGTTVMLGISVK